MLFLSVRFLGPDPQEKAKAVIDEIEEIKRAEALMYERYMESEALYKKNLAHKKSKGNKSKGT